MRGRGRPRREEDDMNAPPRAVRHRLPRRAHVGHAQIRRRRSRRLHHRRPLSRRQPGELFITMAKEGSTVSGLMDSFACAVSLALQHGVPLKLLCEKFAHTRFEPSGWSKQPKSASPNHHGLHLPLAPVALPDRTAADAVREPEAAARGSNLSHCRRCRRCKRRTLRTSARRCALGHAGPSTPPMPWPSTIDLGDAPTCSFCGSHHDAQRQLLPLHELRQHEWLQLIFSVVILMCGALCRTKDSRLAARCLRCARHVAGFSQICRKRLLSAPS